ncbi:MAG TPA: hypothetical protein PLK05_11650 [Steroidobacteraceae bacterium]|nr:hypothetical protein [Steroidobacteraceae bacterium]
MSGSIALRARGLVDSHELASEPGGLTVAEGVVIEPGGSIAVRPTFWAAAELVHATQVPRTLIGYGGEWCAISDDGTSRLYTASGAGTPVTGAVQPPDDVTEHPWFSSRGSLYVASNLGWRKLTSTLDTALEGAGIESEIMWNPLVIFGASGLGDQAPQYTGKAAYRMCVKRTDANNYVRRSKPTQRYVTDGNVIGGAWSALGNAGRYYCKGLVAGDVIEWYRTRGSGSPSVEPSASCYLVATYKITSTDVSNGYFVNSTLYDVVTDDNLGAALYTNPERSGVAKAKYEPPIARCGAVFNRCAWYGDTESKHRIISSLRGVGTAVEFVGDTAGPGDPNIYNVVSVSGLAVGQYVCDSQTTPRSVGTEIPALTRITAISAGPAPYTITLSTDIATATVGVTFAACNWVDPVLFARSCSTGDFTSGTATILNVPNVTGLYAGMYLTDDGNLDGPTVAGAPIPALTKIVSISGAGPYTITMNKNATSTVTTAFRVHDYITIGGVEFYASDVGSWYAPGTGYITAVRTFPCGVTGFDTVGQVVKILSLVVDFNSILSNAGIRMICTGAEDAFGAYTSGDFVLEEIGLGGSAFTLAGNTSAQSVQAFSPPLTSTITSTDDAATNRVFWSDPDEPEAVPIVNFVDLATSSARVQRLVPLRASLLAFTTEGLYRISGVAPDAWAVDLIDPTVSLVTRNTVAVIDNTAYAWTPRGVIAVDESGFTDVSSGAVGKRLDAYARFDRAYSPLHCWVATWQAAHLVVVGPSAFGETGGEIDGEMVSDANGETSELFVYNTQSRAWTTWPFQMRRALEIDSSLYHIRGDRFDVLRSDGTSDGSDRMYAATAWSYAAGATTLVLTAANMPAGWRPRVGDYFRAVDASNDWSPEFRRIVSFAETSGDYTFTLSRAFTNRPLTGVDSLECYEVATVDLEWCPLTAGALPGVHARWREASLTIDTSDYVAAATTLSEIEPGFGATTSLVDETTSRKIVALTTARVTPIRFAMPRSVGRGQTIWPRFKLGIVGFGTRIFGLAMHRLDASERVRR